MKDWTPALLAIDTAITGMGTFQEPQPGFENLTWGEWQLTRAQRILAAVEEEQKRAKAAKKKEVVFKRGWNWVLGSNKWHYFLEDGHSLCGRWLIFSANADAEDNNDGAKENCTPCRKKVEKLREKEAKDAQAKLCKDSAGESGPAGSNSQ